LTWTIELAGNGGFLSRDHKTFTHPVRGFSSTWVEFQSQAHGWSQRMIPGMEAAGALTAPHDRFDYETAFSRNLGWLGNCRGSGAPESDTDRDSRACRPRLADLDTFELANFNRQAGATVSTLGRAKVDVVTATALDINPGLDIRTFGSGVDASNLDAFLDGVDIYVDGTDLLVSLLRLCTVRI
jgi:hypothetical protein